ncbi:hypothetical protein C1T31_05300 [Hanstruepera neustonica]|uniref:DUF418 domain-containing protein n=1 Tax=Hanstruepera neustonica TaxID=1445657 RepID=A0A2K1E0D3_9FLAO|nr:DUF418 domain-containing protein [Hanstruepera neustonica]PNQ73752.1 hypothetical protein C1T31_05300 [Hanstruepera neustonica]
MESDNVKPISKSERIAYLDILRGISILFIYTANIIMFSGIWFFPEDTPRRIYTLPTDEVFDFLNYVLVDGKFYSIFSLLFGIGCVIQFNNLTAHGKAFAPFFRRRMFWLLIIGGIHLVLFWPGDILTLYAVLGFFLIWFVRKSNKTLLTTAVILILFPLVNWAFMHFSGVYYPGMAFQKSTEIYQNFGMPIIEFQGQIVPDFVAYQLNENIADFFKMNLGNTFVRIGRILDEGRLFKVFGIFLIGIWAGRKILNENILDNTAFLKKVFLIGLLVGLPVNIVRGYIEFFVDSTDTTKLFHVLAYALGTLPLALSYAAGIALLVKKKVHFLDWFKPVGKTALSNYLFQTAISTIIFYGFGFNLVGKFGFTYVMMIGLCVFIIQIVCSKIWLNYFKFGPMEWLWRKLTYGVQLKIKK